MSPGATRSGFNRPSVVGPSELYGATLLSRLSETGSWLTRAPHCQSVLSVCRGEDGALTVEAFITNGKDNQGFRMGVKPRIDLQIGDYRHF